MRSILYIGMDNPGTTSEHRARALERLGYKVSIKNPYADLNIVQSGNLSGAFHFKTGYRFLQPAVRSWIRMVVQSCPQYDLIWIDSGELFNKRCVELLRPLAPKILLYNIDDPTGKRDGQRFASLRNALPSYDLVVVVRTETEQECKNLGAKRVVRVFRSYDEIAHQRLQDDSELLVEFGSEVAFIGTWMRHERRDEFFLELISQGIPVSIWGDRWQKSRYYEQLAPYIRGGAIFGRDYVAAIQGSKICIGMLSRGNRDLHTTRSLEIPYAGGLLCAERTLEHAQLFKDGVEAVFWNDAKECATVCKKLLSDDKVRNEILAASKRRIQSLYLGNEDVCKQVIRALENDGLEDGDSYIMEAEHSSLSYSPFYNVDVS